MRNEVVLDLETQDTFQEVGGYDPVKLHISLVGIYSYADDTYRSFLEPELPKLWKYLEQADAIVGYNTNHFDLPILNKYYPGEIGTFFSIDLMAAIEKSLGFRVKLEDVGQATLGRGKTGTGLQAIQFFKAHDFEKLASYCLEDVRLTKDLYEFARAHGKVMFRDRTGVVREVPVALDVVPKKAAPLNLTMPF